MNPIPKLKSLRVTVAATMVLGTCGTKSVQSNKSLLEQNVGIASSVPKISRWDLAITFPPPNTKEKAALTDDLSLADFGFDLKRMVALVGHMDAEISLPGMRYPAGHVGEVGGRIIGKFSEIPCLKDANNWRVSFVRFAPYETMLAGQPEVLDRMEKEWSIDGLRRLAQVHLVFKPVCVSSINGNLEVKDHAFHLNYFPMPNAEVAKRISKAAETVKSSLLKGNFEGSKKAASNFGSLVTSKVYTNYRRKLIASWTKLSEVGRDPQDGTTLSLENWRLRMLKILAGDGLIWGYPKEFKEDSLTHPALLAATEHGSDSYLKVLKEILKNYATLDDLRTVTAMRARSNEDWFFTQINYTRSISDDELVRLIFPEQKEAAKAQYASFAPLELETFYLELTDKGAKLTKMTGGVFAQNAGAPMQLMDENGFMDLRTSAAKADSKHFFEIDFVGKTDSSSGEGVKPSQGTMMNTVSRIIAPKYTKATTTTCQSCHSIQAAHPLQGDWEAGLSSFDFGLSEGS